MIISLMLALLRIAKSTISVLIGPLQLVLATQVKPAGHVTLGIQNDLRWPFIPMGTLTTATLKR
ncbi:hypothetical protein N9N07_01430 [Pseudomonadales bacterium]|nr:hypothetical protein [Pseudomonadales bacterium]